MKVFRQSFKYVLFTILVITTDFALADEPIKIADLKVEVLLDDSVLPFPEPIYGIMRVTNQSPHAAYMPPVLCGELEFDVAERKSQLSFGPNMPLSLYRLPKGYSLVVPFQTFIEDKGQVEAILNIDSTVSISLSIDAIPWRIPTKALEKDGKLTMTKLVDTSELFPPRSS